MKRSEALAVMMEYQDAYEALQAATRRYEAARKLWNSLPLSMEDDDACGSVHPDFTFYVCQREAGHPPDHHRWESQEGPGSAEWPVSVDD